MTITQLIERLSKIKNQKKQVKIFHQNGASDWLELQIEDIVDNEDVVLLGDNLPPEVYGADYKNERP